jgi:hypothetical protein
MTSTQVPSWGTDLTKVPRCVFVPQGPLLLVERIDWKDAPDIYNVNEYELRQTSTGGWLQGPPRSPSLVPVAHHLPKPSTWIDDQPQAPKSW